jgi:hypothetical protein
MGGRRGQGSRRSCESARVLVHDRRGEGGADRAVPWCSERESEQAGVTGCRCFGPAGTLNRLVNFMLRVPAWMD